MSNREAAGRPRARRAAPAGGRARPERRYWIGVASRDHVRRGVEGAFGQLGHGRRAPLARMASGDWIVYYSPRVHFPDGGPCRRFTALGQIAAGGIYQVKMSAGFTPYRRAIRFLPARKAAIEPLLPRLGFIKDKRRWGFIFRRGHFQISERDFSLIAAAMGADLPSR